MQEATPAALASAEKSPFNWVQCSFVHSKWGLPSVSSIRYLRNDHFMYLFISHVPGEWVLDLLLLLLWVKTSMCATCATYPSQMSLGQVCLAALKEIWRWRNAYLKLYWNATFYGIILITEFLNSFDELQTEIFVLSPNWDHLLKDFCRHTSNNMVTRIPLSHNQGFKVASMSWRLEPKVFWSTLSPAISVVVRLYSIQLGMPKSAQTLVRLIPSHSRLWNIHDYWVWLNLQQMH